MRDAAADLDAPIPASALGAVAEGPVPPVSVIVTAYAVGPWIATALQSALDADIEGAEIVVVDDGSPDGCAALDCAMRRNLHRARWRVVRLARNTPGGVGTAANIGLSASTGRAVVFLDGDDWLDPAALRDALALLDRSGADMVFTDCRDFAESHGRVEAYPDAHLWETAQGAASPQELKRALLRFAPMPWRKIYTRDFLDRSGLAFPVGPWFFEDTAHHWEAVLAARRIALFRRPLHMHRLGSGQSIAGRGRKFLAIFDHHDAIRAMLRRRDPRGAYAESFADWTIRHAWWALERIDASGPYAFWQAARPRIAAHDPALMDEALRLAGLPPRGAALMAAVLAGDRTGFVAMFPQAMLPR